MNSGGRQNRLVRSLTRMLCAALVLTGMCVAAAETPAERCPGGGRYIASLDECRYPDGRYGTQGPGGGVYTLVRRETPGPWGAVAAGQSRLSAGVMALNYETRDEAIQAAMARCLQDDSSCGLVIAFENQCVALAQDEQFRPFAATGETEQQAQAQALSQCLQGGHRTGEGADAARTCAPWMQPRCTPQP